MGRSQEAMEASIGRGAAPGASPFYVGGIRTTGGRRLAFRSETRPPCRGTGVRGAQSHVNSGPHAAPPRRSTVTGKRVYAGRLANFGIWRFAGLRMAILVDGFLLNLVFLLLGFCCCGVFVLKMICCFFFIVFFHFFRCENKNWILFFDTTVLFDFFY